MARRPAADADAGPRVDDYRPLSRRRRLLIALLAVATAATVMFMVLEKPGGPPRTRKPTIQPCAPGQTQGCVGGRTEVIVVPPAADPAPATSAR